MSPHLRIIIDPPCSAAFNMAADIWTLKNIPDNCVQLRLYSWQTPTITLGYMQNPAALLDLDACNRDAISWIRRITGGRAVLHDQDITYSCIFPNTLTAMGRSIAESYEIISHCLQRGLLSVNIIAQGHAPSPAATKRPAHISLPCFLSPNRREIMVNGKKLIGSAQKRTDAAVLQHGSMPLSGRYRLISRYLNIDKQERARQELLLCEKSAGVAEINPGLTAEALKQALAEGFREYLKADSKEEPWNKQERQTIVALSASDEFVNQWMNPARLRLQAASLPVIAETSQ